MMKGAPYFRGIHKMTLSGCGKVVMNYQYLNVGLQNRFLLTCLHEYDKWVGASFRNEFFYIYIYST